MSMVWDHLHAALGEVLSWSEACLATTPHPPSHELITSPVNSVKDNRRFSPHVLQPPWQCSESVCNRVG